MPVVRHDGTASACHTMGMACSNCVFFGYPIALLIVGPTVGVMLGLNMMVEDLLLLLVLAESGERRGGACDTAKPQKPRNPETQKTIKIGRSRISNVH